MTVNGTAQKTLFLLMLACGSACFTENVTLGIVAATGGVCLVYLMSLIGGLFGFPVPSIHAGGARRHRIQPGRSHRFGVRSASSSAAGTSLIRIWLVLLEYATNRRPPTSHKVG
jgi:hypothetical protein